MMLNWPLHKDILRAILHDIFTAADMAPYVGFKGGTAALFFYELPRYSVDLDLDLIDGTKAQHLFDRVNEILMNYGSVTDSLNKRYSLFFRLSYKDKLEGAYNIKVEINKRNFGSAYEIKQFLGTPMRVMKQADMAANELVALYERKGKARRDIYDVWFFLKSNWPVTTEIIKKRTELDYETFLQRCIDMIETIDNTYILLGLGDLLTAEQKSWARKHLKKDTLFYLNLTMSNELEKKR